MEVNARDTISLETERMVNSRPAWAAQEDRTSEYFIQL